MNTKVVAPRIGCVYLATNQSPQSHDSPIRHSLNLKLFLTTPNSNRSSFRRLNLPSQTLYQITTWKNQDCQIHSCYSQASGLDILGKGVTLLKHLRILALGQHDLLSFRRSLHHGLQSSGYVSSLSSSCHLLERPYRSLL